MQRIGKTIRLFAGQLSEKFPIIPGRRNCSIEYRKTNGASQRLFNSNAKADNTNIVLLFNSYFYFRKSAGAIR
jgi:hypothetical protein